MSRKSCDLDQLRLGPQGGGCPSIVAGSLLPFSVGVRLGREVEEALEGASRPVEEKDRSHSRIRRHREKTRKKVRKVTSP